MAGDKYKAIGTNGLDLEKQAIQTSAGAGDAGKIPALDASGLLDASMIPGAGVYSVTASENITAGDMINLHDSSGLKVRKADKQGSNASKKVDGFAKETFTTGNPGQVQIGPGLITGLSGLTVGDEYFLGDTGAITDTPTTTSGECLQRVGKAKSTTELFFEPYPPVVRA